jgi:DNA modification methylase
LVCAKKEFVDTTVTSPPYWNLKNYKSKAQVGYGQGYQEYLRDLRRIFAGIYKITKRSGSLWIVVDTIKCNGELKLLPFDLAAELKKDGWILQDLIVWHKDKTLPWSHRGKLRNIFEYVLFFTKSPRFKYYLSRVRETEGLKRWWVRYPERYSPQGKAPTRTWSFPIPRQGSWGENWVRHFCPLPPDLVRRVVLLTTKKRDVVLDPFAGSGVVLAQSKALGRRFIGFDLRKSYRRMFETKVLPSLVALEKENKRGQLNQGKQRRRFSSLIWKLRKTKYPRELLRLYEKQHGRTKVAGVFAFSQKTHSLRVVFVFPNGKSPGRQFLSRMESLMRRPPLSKYGIRAQVSTHTIGLSHGAGTQNGVHSYGVMNLYKDGKTYRAANQLSTGEFLKSLQNGLGRKAEGVPVLASNLRVTAPREVTS